MEFIKNNHQNTSTALFSSTHWKYFRLVLLFVVSLSAVNAASPGIFTSLTSIIATTSKKKSFHPLKAVKAAFQLTRTPKIPAAAVPVFDGIVNWWKRREIF
jgi:hypothetical protein